MGRRSGAQGPRLAVEISATWEPDGRLQQHRLVRALTGDELVELVSLFRAFCLKHKLKRVIWGTTFTSWLQKRGDPAWKPKALTDIWE